MPYDELLPYRPPNVVQQMHLNAYIPLLNGRHLLAAAVDLPGCLCWAPVVHDAATVIGVLRAAAHRKTFIGITMSPKSAERQQLRQLYSPRKFFQMVTEATEQITDAPPFFLHVQEPPIHAALRVDFEAVRDHIASCIEAGFTSVGLDLSRCNTEQISQTTIELLHPVLDYDLGVVMRLPESDLEKNIMILRKHKIDPSLIMLPGPGEIDNKASDLADRLKSVIAPGGVAWLDSKKNIKSPNMVVDITEGRVKALIGGERFLSVRTDETGQPDLEKREALVYLEALHLLDELGQKGSALKLFEKLQS